MNIQDEQNLTDIILHYLNKYNIRDTFYISIKDKQIRIDNTKKAEVSPQWQKD